MTTNFFDGTIKFDKPKNLADGDFDNMMLEFHQKAKALGVFKFLKFETLDEVIFSTKEPVYDITYECEMDPEHELGNHIFAFIAMVLDNPERFNGIKLHCDGESDITRTVKNRNSQRKSTKIDVELVDVTRSSNHSLVSWTVTDLNTKKTVKLSYNRNNPNHKILSQEIL